MSSLLMLSEIRAILLVAHCPGGSWGATVSGVLLGCCGATVSAL